MGLLMGVEEGGGREVNFSVDPVVHPFCLLCLKMVGLSFASWSPRRVTEGWVRRWRGTCISEVEHCIDDFLVLLPQPQHDG
jgi:hypothetical protein